MRAFEASRDSREDREDRDHVRQTGGAKELKKSSTLQLVAVCCSALQCVAVCCDVLRCAAVCCSVLQCVAVCCGKHYVAACCVGVWHCVALLRQKSSRNQVCCSVLGCVNGCCSVLHWRVLGSVLQRVAVHCSVLQGVAVCCSLLQFVTVCRSVLQCVLCVSLAGQKSSYPNTCIRIYIYDILDTNFFFLYIYDITLFFWGKKRIGVKAVISNTIVIILCYIYATNCFLPCVLVNCVNRKKNACVMIKCVNFCFKKKCVCPDRLCQLRTTATGSSTNEYQTK